MYGILSSESIKEYVKENKFMRDMISPSCLPIPTECAACKNMNTKLNMYTVSFYKYFTDRTYFDWF